MDARRFFCVAGGLFLLVAALVLGVLLSARPATAQAPGRTLELFSDPGGGSTLVTSEGRGTFYVVATSPDFDCSDLTYLEFRIDGLPTGWSVYPTFLASVQTVSGTLGIEGVMIVFRLGQYMFPSPLIICAVTLTCPPSPTATATLTARGHFPLRGSRDLPIFTSNPACWGWGYLDGGTLCVNAPCTVQVETKTWGALKALYR